MSNFAAKFWGLAARAVDVAGGRVFSAYRRDLDKIRKRVKEGSQVAQTKLGPIEYAVEGTGSPVLIIHGAGGGYDQGLFLARSFPSGMQAIAPSRFGYLATPLPQDASPAAQADAHVALLDSLGVNSAIVAGVSAGAPSAVELALSYPKRVHALILLVPRGYVPNRTDDVPATDSNKRILRLILSGADFAYWLALRVARKKLVQFMGVPPELEARAPAVEQERISAILESVLPLSMRIAGIRNDAATKLQPLPLERIKIPTLVITTKDDLFDTLPGAQFMAERIAGAELIVLDIGGHLFVERHREVSAAIADFLVNVQAGGTKTRPLRKSA